MKALDVQHDSVPEVSVDMAADRWEYRAFGKCALIIERVDIIWYHRHHHTFWWASLPELNWKVGAMFPVWLTTRLGLAHDYRRKQEK